MPAIVDYIGPYYFIRVSGQPQSARYFLRDETRPGAAGVAYRRQPKRPIPFQLLSVGLVSLESEAQDAEEAFAAMVGEELYEIGLGTRVYTDILIHNVETLDMRPVVNNGGGVDLLGGINSLNGDQGWLIETQWSCIYAGEVVTV